MYVEIDQTSQINGIAWYFNLTSFSCSFKSNTKKLFSPIYGFNFRRIQRTLIPFNLLFGVFIKNVNTSQFCKWQIFTQLIVTPLVTKEQIFKIWTQGVPGKHTLISLPPEILGL